MKEEAKKRKQQLRTGVTVKYSWLVAG